ncbi:hypothetical protein J7T55_001612 [Diaporthe amygdali]|uniref:uncharacterized protein n=1 Tax=Phomopsis amygdali TaxID=1214568 RepID=UPI0022FE5552|nr:uncharacterized protein J7T55_001612 [Diaporthe amygdali]KAJ0115202.1 hypothetical protein J7T55_001612 [Diaporthe amygdali]
MSGFEVAGVVLAVLPFFIEAGKAYGDHATALQKAVTRSTRDKELQEFYEEFYWDTYELRKNIEKVVLVLPSLSDERKQQVIRSTNLDTWDQAQDVAAALQDFLGADDYDAFQMVMGKVLELLARLIKDKTVHISKSEKDHRKMLEKLKNLQKDRADNKTSTSLWERFKFLKEERRSTYLKNLKRWNERFGKVVDSACEAANERKAVVMHQKEKGPSTRLRTLSKRLFSALWRRWSCSCETPHEARFCIATCGRNSKNDLSKTSITFDFLISHHQSKWCEGTVVIESMNLTTSQDRAELRNVCEAITSGMNPAKYSVQLLVEDSELSQRIWRLNMQEAKLHYPEAFPAISFETLLSRPMPSLIERRRLALTFAYSFMQLYESPWLSGQWEKKRMHFFRMASGDPDLKRPFLSASFDQFPCGPEPVDLRRFHRNSGILRLGILLIEVHIWKPLERFRDEDDLINGQPTPNTDMEVAKRVLKTLKGDCFQTYTSAIESCLSVPWVSSVSRVSLDDPETWFGMYRDIVEPLEKEVNLGNFKPIM